MTLLKSFIRFRSPPFVNFVRVGLKTNPISAPVRHSRKNKTIPNFSKNHHQVQQWPSPSTPPTSKPWRRQCTTPWRSPTSTRHSPTTPPPPTACSRASGRAATHGPRAPWTTSSHSRARSRSTSTSSLERQRTPVPSTCTTSNRPRPTAPRAKPSCPREQDKAR